ncbi:MAG: hypothetical protein OEV74_02605 [Cyclobacteriaceae bacterium]|nr:hypothetical protein [Cyclobacteriaceae bacterium]MDH4295144.1 hypothetical protein [Cyclobacteriaceae bacterium]MDH5249412.1 hypothetical protein [Cyclobacteriaceae bacterium]
MKRILIIGKGNIGTFLGASLNINEHITHFTRKNVVYPKEVILKFTDRRDKKYRINKGIKYQYRTINDAQEIANYEYIIIPVAHYHLKSVINTIKPNLNRNQVLVIMGNVWDDFAWIESSIINPYVFVFPNFGGSIVNGSLQGWLTPNFTTGVTNPDFIGQLIEFESILRAIGFKPQNEKDIIGWLMTHFAYNAGMLLEAAKQDGFQKMTKTFNGLKKMYATMRECMNVVSELNIDVNKFKEGRAVYRAMWWNVIKTYLMFSLPGLAKSADASKNIEDWTSYSGKIWETAKQKNISVPILNSYHKEKSILND